MIIRKYATQQFVCCTAIYWINNEVILSYLKGLQEYQAALKIDPNNPKLQEDVQKIRDIVQGASG